MIRRSLGELAALVGGEVAGDPNVGVTGAADIGDAREGDIVFAESAKHLERALRSPAVAVIALPGAVNSSKSLIRTPNPRLAFARILGALAPRRRHLPGIHETSCIGANLQVGQGAYVGFHAFVGDDVILGDDVEIHPHAYVGDNVRVGSNSVLHPFVAVLDDVTIGDNVTIHAGTVVGADGFGYTPVGAEHYKIPQVGEVVIEDNVEIGANCTIDRARTGKTVIGRGTKIDNLVHIAHNVTIGRNCIVVAQVGVSGSVHIGDNVIFGGQAGVRDHVNIGDNCMVCARAGITSNLPSGSFVSGFPAGPHKEQMRAQAAVLRLPELMKAYRDLERRIKILEEGSE